MLHLGLPSINLGPTLPQFLTPELLSVLVDRVDIRPTSEARADLNHMLAAA